MLFALSATVLEAAKSWGEILGIAAFAFYQVYTTRKAAAERAEQTKKLEVIRLQGNSVLGEHLRVVAMLSERIANDSGQSGDQQRSEEALKTYQRHVEDQKVLAANTQAVALAAVQAVKGDVKGKEFEAGVATGVAKEKAEATAAKAAVEPGKA